MAKQDAAFREEKKALQTYLHDADQDIAEKQHELQALVIPSPDSFDTDAVFQEIGQAYKTERNLQKSIAEVNTTLNSPYFKRYDVCFEGESKTYYVGNQPIDFGTHNVFQWQQAGEKPVLDFLMQGPSNRYYTDMNGKVHERLLDRSIAIQNRKLIDVSDEFVSDSIYAQLGINDPFLVNVIKRRREEGLTIANIISTVQRNQYEIIRYPTDESFVVQGCAGSGKTYIMLNRLSYLLFNKKVFRLSPEDVIVISPNPRIQYQLANVIIDLNVEDVQQITIEQWYLDLLQQHALLFNNSIIRDESSLPADYENEVFSKSFLDNISALILLERDNIKSQAHILMNNMVIISWARARSIIPSTNDELSGLIAFIRAIEKEARRIEREFHSYCEDNAIPEESLDDLIQDDSTLDEQRQEVDNIEAQIAEILSYNPLFEEYQAAKELLCEENESFENHKKEVETRLQNSLLKIRNIDSMTHEERTKILTKHLNLEADYSDFEDGGARALLHEEHVDECRSMMDEAWKEIIPRLPDKYKTTAIAAQKAMREDCDALLRRMAELEENLSSIASGKNQQRMFQKRANELRSAMLPQAQMKSIVEFMRNAGNLPARARDIAAGILNELKQKHEIPLMIPDADAAGGTRKSPQKRVLYRSDLFVFLLAVTRINERTRPFSWKLMCFDEGQDISRFEYNFIQDLSEKYTKLNIFGDIRQGRLGCESTIQSWSEAFPSLAEFQLNENYRNAHQITELMNKYFSTNMLPIGVDGIVQEATKETQKQVFLNFINSKSARLIIVHDKETFESFIKSLNVALDVSKLSYELIDNRSSITILTIDQIKGLEFPRVLVITEHMNDNQKYIAMTRALSELYIL